MHLTKKPLNPKIHSVEGVFLWLFNLCAKYRFIAKIALTKSQRPVYNLYGCALNTFLLFLLFLLLN